MYWVKRAVAGMLCGALVLGCGGCLGQPAVVQAVGSMEVAAVSYRGKVVALVDTLIVDYRVGARRRADELTSAALAAETRSDGTAVVANVQAILAQRARLYVEIEEAAGVIRARLGEADLDMARALQYSAALRGYFEVRGSAGEVWRENEAGALEVLKLLGNR